MNAPFKPHADSPVTDLSDLCCDLCSARPVRTELDGDKLCQECADKWCRSQEPDEIDADELRASLRNAGVYRGAMIEARLEDAELLSLAKGARGFGRSGM